MRWKWIAGAVALLICVIIAAVFIILSRYDFNHLKPQISRIAKEATGRELTLGGDIDLKISLTPKLLVENVSFQNASWGSRPEMVKVRRVEVQVAILPLIGKKIEIKRLVLVEPDILILENSPHEKAVRKVVLEPEAIIVGGVNPAFTNAMLLPKTICGYQQVFIRPGRKDQ